MIGWSIECLLRWLKIRERQGHPFPRSSAELRQLTENSALLQRLLEGKQELPNPPPKTMHFPWYDLVERGYGEPLDVTVATPEMEVKMGGPGLMIDQEFWRIIREVNKEKYVCCYGNDDTRWMVSVSGRDQTILDAVAKGKLPKSEERQANRWRIERIGQPSSTTTPIARP